MTLKVKHKAKSKRVLWRSGYIPKFEKTDKFVFDVSEVEPSDHIIICFSKLY